MDPSRVPSEELLPLDQPQHLGDKVDRLSNVAHIMEVNEVADESTPLVLRAGRQHESSDKQPLAEKIATQDADLQAPGVELLREEAVSLIKLSVPITLMMFLEFVPLVVIAMMIGSASGDRAPQVLAAGSLSDFFQSQVFVNVTSGLGAAIATMCAQAFGAKQHRQLWIYAQAGLIASFYTAVPIVLLCVKGPAILVFLGQDPELARIAGVFIVIGLASQIFYMMYAVIRSALQAQNIAAPFVVASLASYLVSLPLAYYLGYSTSLGYNGVALSVIVSSLVKLLVAIPVLLKNELYVSSWPGWQWREANQVVRRLWPIGAGSILMVTFQTAGFNVVALLCGYLPQAATVMTSSSIASSLLSIAFVPMVGLCAGGTVRVGNALGAGEARRASFASAVIVGAMLSVALMGICVCWACAGSYATAYTTDSPTIMLTAQIVRYLLPLIPLVGFVYAAQSIFQACGAQWLCANLNFLFLFALGVPFGLILALAGNRGVFGLWDGQELGTLGFVLAASVWLRSLDWHAVACKARANAHLHLDREPTKSSA